MKRPEWVKCIQKSDGIAFCGRDVLFRWTFVDLEHAQMALFADAQQVPCEECLREAKKERPRSVETVPEPLTPKRKPITQT